MANHSTESLLGLDGLEHVSWYEYRSPLDRLDWNPYKFTVAQDLRAMSTPTRPEDGLSPRSEKIPSACDSKLGWRATAWSSGCPVRSLRKAWSCEGVRECTKQSRSSRPPRRRKTCQWSAGKSSSNRRSGGVVGLKWERQEAKDRIVAINLGSPARVL